MLTLMKLITEFYYWIQFKLLCYILYNWIQLYNIRNKIIIYRNIDSTKICDNGDSTDHIPKYLNTASLSGLSPYKLHLRLLSLVMLKRNIINEDLCNERRLFVLDIRNNVLNYQILTGNKCVNIVFLHRMNLSCEKNSLLLKEDHFL